MAIKKKGLITALIGITAASAAVAGSIWLIRSNQSTEIPDFTGQYRLDVERWAKDKNINENQLVFTYRYDEIGENDTVLSQNPAGGERLAEDEKFTVTLSRGADPNVEFTMPDFSGKTGKEIRKWFDDNKFLHVEYLYEYTEDETVSEGGFISSEPAAGAKLKRSANVSVHLYTKQLQEVTVPDLSGYSLNNIRAWADENRISLNIEYVESDTEPDSRITAVSVEPGTVIHTGDRITVTVISRIYQDTAETAPAVEPVPFANETATAPAAPTETVTAPPSVPEEKEPTVPHVPEQQEETPANPEPEQPQETPVPEEPEPVVEAPAVCPQRPLPSGMFPSEDSIYLFMNSEYPGCAVVISYYDNEQNNPSNMQGCASNYAIDDTTWQFEFYKEWNR
ncbi:MAG: PASTA domain-containing protein [Solobacterium sp.]|nr:PASTA domain-containing protein [Solobacterium sp.]